MGTLQAMLGLAMQGRQRLQQATAHALWAAAAGARRMSSLPEHTVLGMPALSPTMSQGNLAVWHVKVGDKVGPGSILADIETDKATMGFENQDDGVVAHLCVKAGASDLPLGTPLLVLVEDASSVAAFANYTAPSSAASGASAPAPPSSPTAAPPQQVVASKPKAVANHRLGPAARMLLLEAGLSVSDITPSGPHDIITKGDVLAAIQAGVRPGSAAKPAAAAAATAAAVAAPAAPASPSQPAAASAVAAAPAGKAAPFTDIPNTQIRKIIAQRLLESKVTIPSLYGSVDVELDSLTALRKGLAEQGVKLSVNDFVLKAIAQALKEVPAANSLWDSQAKVSVAAPSIDISVAVATERGLITPIVKNADVKTVAQISQDVKALAAKAKANKLKPEEFQGGSFTVSNLGMYGVAYFSAIINPPQGAILAVGGAQQRVRLVGGKPQAHHVMTVTLSADHRMYDGELLSQVLAAFKKHMQSPASLVM